MNHYILTLRMVVFALILFLTGCSSVEQKVDNPQRSKLGVLIIAGEGLNSKYDDIKDIQVNSVWFITSQKMAESLFSEIEKRGTKAQLYVNTNRDIDTRTYVAQIIAAKRRDGLIQVMIKHIKNETENSVYLILSYNALQFHKTNTGDSMTIESGVEEKYKLLGDGFDGRRTPLSKFAVDFSDKLSKAGYIGGE